VPVAAGANIVHDLQLGNWSPDAGPYDWIKAAIGASGESDNVRQAPDFVR
jgi:hypothetical protein